MHGQQAHVGQFCCCGNGFRNSVWDVVKFQVEEDIGAKTRKLFYGFRALGGKKLVPNLNEANNALELLHQGAGRRQAVYVQGQD